MEGVGYSILITQYSLLINKVNPNIMEGVENSLLTDKINPCIIGGR